METLVEALNRCLDACDQGVTVDCALGTFVLGNHSIESGELATGTFLFYHPKTLCDGVPFFKCRKTRGAHSNIFANVRQAIVAACFCHKSALTLVFPF